MSNGVVLTLRVPLNGEIGWRVHYSGQIRAIST
jgi:hypothetical protein